MRQTFACVFVLLLFAVVTSAALATVKPNGLFSDGVVLQQGVRMPVWGTAKNGERVTVRFQNQQVSTVARNGRWMVRLKPLKAGGPFGMTIAGENTVEVRNVLVGEVWLCSGQSNMAWAMRRSAEAQEAFADCNDPMLREYHVPNYNQFFCSVPASDVSGRWVESSSKTAGEFSAVSFYFGKELRKSLNVPVGLINSSLSDSPAEAWTSREALDADPDLKRILAYPGPFRDHYRPCILYNSMIAPLIPFPIRGAIGTRARATSQGRISTASCFRP